jgi:hypothetical protein
MTEEVTVATGPEAVPGLDLVPVFANRVNVTSNPVFTRLVYGESLSPDKICWHGAIVMPTVDIPSVIQVLQKVMELQASNIGTAGMTKQ